MGKEKHPKIDALFKRKRDNTPEDTTIYKSISVDESIPVDEFLTMEHDADTSNPPACPLDESNTIIIDNITEALERDPGKRKQIWEYPVEFHNEIRRAYIRAGPYKPKLTNFPLSGPTTHPRRFQSSWYKIFLWLEYSPQKDAAFCQPCYLFNKEDSPPGFKAFTIDGFRNWKKVRSGKSCSFSSHVGKVPNTTHKNAEKRKTDLLNQKQHLPQVLDKQTTQQIKEYRLRLKVSIDAVLFLAFQGCALRGHDERENSLNRGNFIELVKLFASYNSDAAKVVLENAPKNASYISSDIQKDILHILGEKVKRAIRDEIGDSKYCIIVDEASDVSDQEQMAIILRYVDHQGLIKERFFSIVHVTDILATTLKEVIYSVLSRYTFEVQNIRGQGYDGASNMRGEWNGLQALINKDCPFAYYVHCFAHRLQLALVAAAKEIRLVYKFFSQLNIIVNVVLASPKRNNELKAAYADEVAYLIQQDELETGTGLNQIGTLQRPGDTRWGSHLRSISSLMKMFSSTCVVLNKLIDEGRTAAQRGGADAAFEAMTTSSLFLLCI